LCCAKEPIPAPESALDAMPGNEKERRRKLDEIEK